MLTRLVSPRYAALVLKALLQGKLPRRVVVREDDADNPALLELTRREDLLTAAVFSRLAYLPSNVAWDILRRAAKPLEENGVAKTLASACPTRATRACQFRLGPQSDPRQTL
jgi:hypothetical protein